MTHTTPAERRRYIFRGVHPIWTGHNSQPRFVPVTFSAGWIAAEADTLDDAYAQLAQLGWPPDAIFLLRSTPPRRHDDHRLRAYRIRAYTLDHQPCAGQPPTVWSQLLPPYTCHNLDDAYTAAQRALGCTVDDQDIVLTAQQITPTYLGDHAK